MKPRFIAIGMSILALLGLIATALMQPAATAPAAAPPPIRVPGIETTIQVAPGAPIPGPVIEVLPPLPEIDPPPAVEKPPVVERPSIVEKPAPIPKPATAPIPPKEAIQKPKAPECQPVECQPQCQPCWGWRWRCR